MNTDLHKRFEEAADNYIGHPYEIEEGIDITDKRTAFKAGAELGYKEAIKNMVQYLQRNHAYNESLAIHSDFETDMYKLLEEE